MSKNSVKLLYRYMCKNINVQENRYLFKESIKIEMEKLSNSASNSNNKIKEWEEFIQNYLKMKFHIDNENSLLESYNINVVRDSKREIISVARKVGLEI
jgi:hypothetical protein